jgi:hypothetical protein
MLRQNMATDSIKGTRWSNLPDPTKYDLKEVGKDVRAAGKALNPSDTVRGAALDAVKKAGVRGGTRLGAAGVGAAAALGAGYLAGRGIDSMTGAGKKIVDESGLGDLAEEMANKRDKVELSEESKARISRGDLEEKPKARANKDFEGGGGGTRSEPKNRALMENREPKEEAMKRGGVTRTPASKRADGIATKGFTKGKYL